ncbi:UDP-N-acetylmuramate dehydrogenase [Patescibacteria group bacterium]|nr:UDP-N-acetylmuramate dehydrogenase [Patescibacteria group bacterium]
MIFEENISLKEYTTFKVGGLAKFFYIAKTKESLIEAIKKALKKNLPIFILGGGSNVLALDSGYDGLVIKIHHTKHIIQDTNVYAEAGLSLRKLIHDVNNESLSGFEWAAGIPGTIGGAIYGNARAFGVNISDIIKEVEVLDKESLEIKTLSKNQCQFSEKQSIFKKDKNLIILSVILELEKGNERKIKETIEENLKSRRERQPLEYPSAGSIFINKEGAEPSSVLIDKAGLKGTKVNSAEISQKHAGFIINTGNAGSADVLELIEIIKKEIKFKFGIELETEIQIIK